MTKPADPHARPLPVVDRDLADVRTRRNSALTAAGRCDADARRSQDSATQYRRTADTLLLRLNNLLDERNRASLVVDEQTVADIDSEEPADA